MKYVVYLYIIRNKQKPASQTPKQIHRAVVLRMRNLREYKQYLIENGAEYKEGEVHPMLMSFSQFQKVGYNPIDSLYSQLDMANEAWYQAEKRGQDVVGDITCDGYHARRNAMNLTHRIESLEKR